MHKNHKAKLLGNSLKVTKEQKENILKIIKHETGCNGNSLKLQKYTRKIS